MTMEKLPPAYKSVVKSWLNNIPELQKLTNTNDLKWIAKFHNVIDKYIMKPITKNKDGKDIKVQRADVTLRGHYNILLQIVRGLKKPKLEKIYKAKFDKYVKKIIADNINQPLLGNQLENFVEWPNIIKKRDQILQRFMENPTNNYNNISNLALALMTFIPPIRGEYSDMKIIYDKKDDNDIDNFILKKKGKYTVIINNDKVSSKYGKGILQIKSFALTNLINISLEEYPRKYLLSTSIDPDKPLKYKSFYNMLLNAFKNEGKKVSVDVIRKSFLTDYYSKAREPIKEIELARRMRHSVDTAKNHYRRWLSDDDKKKIELKILPL